MHLLVPIQPLANHTSFVALLTHKHGIRSKHIISTHHTVNLHTSPRQKTYVAE